MHPHPIPRLESTDIGVVRNKIAERRLYLVLITLAQICTHRHNAFDYVFTDGVITDYYNIIRPDRTLRRNRGTRRWRVDVNRNARTGIPAIAPLQREKVFITDKPRDKLRRGSGINMLRRVVLLDYTAVHDGDFIRYRKAFLLVMRYENCCDFKFLLNLAYFYAHFQA